MNNTSPRPMNTGTWFEPVGSCSWGDPMQERFDKTAASDAAYRRMTRDYPHTTQVEVSDDFGRFAAACAMLGFFMVLGYFLIRKIFG